MPGFEIASVVLAVPPIAVKALKSANRGEVVFRRKRHIDELIYELQEQQACLALTVRALFIRSGVTEFPDDWEKLPGLLTDQQRTIYREAIEDFLEPKVFEIYKHSLNQCERAVSEIAYGIRGGDSTKAFRRRPLTHDLEIELSDWANHFSENQYAGS